MDNVLIDDRRIHVDFSQSVAKLDWIQKRKSSLTTLLVIFENMVDYAFLGTKEPEKSSRNGAENDRRSKPSSGKSDNRRRPSPPNRRPSPPSKSKHSRSRSPRRSRTPKRSDDRRRPSPKQVRL